MYKHLSFFIRCCLLFLSCTGIAQPDLHFEHLDIEDGLSDNTVECVFQDSKGFMWFGTETGLTRFDGLEMKVYYFDADQPELNYPKTIDGIIEDDDETLWMHGLEALYHYDPRKDSFEAHQIDKSQKGLYNILHALHLDSRGHIWVGTLLHGLMRFEPDSNRFLSFANEFDLELSSDFVVDEVIEDSFGDLWFNYPKGLYKFSWSDSSISNYPFQGVYKGFSVVNTIFEDSQNRLWIGTDVGLHQYDQEKDTFLFYPIDPLQPELQYEVTVIEESADGKLWMWSPKVGLNILDTESLDVFYPSKDPSYPEDLGDNPIQHLYRDREGSMWLSTLSKGVYYWNRNRKPFFSYPYSQVPSVSNGQKHLISRQESTNGEIWVSETGEVAWFNPENLAFFRDYSPLLGQLAIRDRGGLIWIGSWGSDLTKIEPFPLQITTFKATPDQPDSLPGTMPNRLLEDKRGNIWIGFWLDGLYRYNPQGDNFIAYPLIDPQTKETMKLAIWGMYEDRQENLWLGEYTQLIKLRPDRTQDAIFNIPECYQFQEDDKGNLWIATAQGLCRLNIKSGSYRFWRKKDGLPHDRLYSILMDDHGIFWMGTHKGLSRFDPNTEEFKNYDTSDGIPGNKFHYSACRKNRDGTFYYGTQKGILRFHPDSIRDNPNIPPVVITQLQIQNKSIPIGHSKGDTLDFPFPLETQIAYTEKIRLQWWQNDLIFEFRALNYFQPHKNKYQYRLENYDRDWIKTDAQRPLAAYTNLNPGHYTLQVKGSNDDGTWNEDPTELEIIIRPPWWWNSWSKAFYLGLFLFILWLLRKYEIKRQKLKYELELEQVRAKELKEVNEFKSRFFTNISHEFRTPLTLILGPLQELIDKRPRGYLPTLQLIQRNSQRLLKLINQILDLSKLEAREMKLKASEKDLVAFLKMVFSLFNSSAEAKNIHYTFLCDHNSMLVYFDREKLEKILVNLLGNAFKFTPEGGKIQLSLQKLERTAEVMVSDSGPGIPPDQLSNIFDRFFQVDNSISRSFEGTGVGLTLVKELAELHRGTIEAENDPEGGARFILQLPLGKEHLEKDEIIIPSIKPASTLTIGHVPVQETPPVNAGFSGADLPLVLIIDDTADMRTYIRQSLEFQFQSVEATGGQQGINFALEQIPDLIICDVMMPEVDGFEVCKKLKTDERTSHIPIVLLTAKADMDAKVEGLESGADAYLTKPFYKEELLVRIRKLIELRQKLQMRYQNGLPLGESSNVNLEKEDAFLNKLKVLVEENINDTEYGVPQLCRALGMSRSQLYRKVKALTNESVGHFILLVRLYKARELLKTTDLNISEVAYEVGFKDPAYFNRTFKKEFGANPSETR